MNETNGRLLGNGWRIAGWCSAAALLALPGIGMLLTDEVDWTFGDFVFAAGLLLVSGLAMELALRSARSWPRLIGLAVATFTAFFTVWANLAVGILGDEGNPVNQLFFAALFAGLLGAAILRFRSRPTARIAAALAVSQFAIGIYAAAEATRPYVEWGVLALLAVLWSVAALCLARDAQR